MGTEARGVRRCGPQIWQPSLTVGGTEMGPTSMTNP